MSEFLLPAYLRHNDYIGWIALPYATGWIASTAWIILGAGGIAVLLWSLMRARRPAFSQIAAVAASCLWGFVCLTGYGMAVLDLPCYPFPLLGLPLYPVILVYGILRYGVFVANAWARRALVWTLLRGAGRTAGGRADAAAALRIALGVGWAARWPRCCPGAQRPRAPHRRAA